MEPNFTLSFGEIDPNPGLAPILVIMLVLLLVAMSVEVTEPDIDVEIDQLLLEPVSHEQVEV